MRCWKRRLNGCRVLNDILFLKHLEACKLEWGGGSQTMPDKPIKRSTEEDFGQVRQMLLGLDLETFMANSSEVMYAKTLTNKIALWSKGAEQTYGYTSEEMVGQPVSLLVPDARAGEEIALIGRIVAGERIEALETERVTKDRRILSVSLTVTPVRDARGDVTGALVTARDLTERREIDRAIKKLEESVESRSLVLDTANRVALDILSQRTGVEALRHIAEAARQLVKAQYAALGVARQGGKGLSEFVTVGLSPEQEAAIGPRPMGAGILGLLLERTEPLRIDVLGKHSHSVGFPENHPPMESFLGVPIRRGKTVIGSLYLTNKIGGQPFTIADETAVETLGAHAAVAIYNMQMLSRQRALVSGLITAHEEERRAIAYDLHDGLTQYVMASHAHLETFRRAHQDKNEERAARELDQGLSYLKEAVVESRRLVNGLRTLALDDLGLAGALEQLLADEKRRAGWKEGDLVHNIAGVRFDKSLETAVYRVAQEGLTNARKHAQAQRVRLLLLLSNSTDSSGPPMLTLEIRDWGKGFVAEEQTEEHWHVGLQSMVERVRLLDGQYELVSQPGQGTMVRAVFPALNPEEI